MEIMLDEQKLMEMHETLEKINDKLLALELKMKVDILDEKTKEGKNKFSNPEKRDWEFYTRSNADPLYCALFQQRTKLKHDVKVLEISLGQMKRQYYSQHNQDYMLGVIAKSLDGIHQCLKK